MGRQLGHGPDDLGDDEQETEVAEDWAAAHPRATGTEPAADESAEQAAIHEIPET